MTKYILRAHDIFGGRVDALKKQVKKFKETLPHEDFIQNEIVKLAVRVRKATMETIPDDPNRPEYRLSSDLKKYRRFKQGLKRYRIMFCFSSKPSIVIYLYLNDEKHLRKGGSKTDPYNEFKKLVKNGTFSHDPSDPDIQQWIQNYSE